MRWLRRIIPSEVRSVVTDTWQALTEAAPDLMPKAPEAPTITVQAPDLTPMNTLIAQQTEAIKQAEAEQTRLAQQLAETQKLNAQRSEELTKAFEKASAPLEKPAAMPSPTSGEARQAARRKAAALQRRGGRASTILSDQDFLGG